MKGAARAVAAILLVAILLYAGMYVYHEQKENALGVPPDDGGDQLVRVNQSAQSIYFGSLSPEPRLSDVNFRLYGPGMGHGDRSASSSDQMNGTYFMEGVLPTVDLLFRDLNNDSMVSRGEYLTVQDTDGPLSVGIWHVEVSYPGHVSGNVSFRFHVLPAGVESYRENVSVAFIDVGQGDAELITTSDGKRVLIDAGTAASRDELLDYLQDRSVTVLDAFIVSHPDADHIGGASRIIEELDVLSIYHPGYPHTSQTYASFLASAEAEGCPVYTDEHLDPGDYLNISATEDFRILAINTVPTDSNDASIVVRMTTETSSFLFTGDIGSEVEEWLVENSAGELDVDVLKVGHHGSRYSSTDAFLAAVTPDLAVIEVGAGNTYGHPHTEALERLAAHGATIVRTDQIGTYVYEVSSGAVIS